MSHSKRNTTRPVFTSYEREQAKSNWTATSAQLSRDSFLPFGYCGLCLENAREPVSCPRGDIFCRECALANLLAQKKELKRGERVRQNAEKEAARIHAIGDEEERERAIRDFEMTQAGLTNSAGKKNSNATTAMATATATATAPAAIEDGNEGAVVRAGSKRKFALDADELGRIAEDDKARARRAIEDEKAAKPTLPSFWTPSLTPDVRNSDLPPVTKKTKTTPTCPASSEHHPHSLSLQKLLTIQFNETTDDSTKETHRTCPSCLKTLSNALSPVMAEKCGHVLCLNCVKKFVLPSGKQQAKEEDEAPIACFVCSTPVAVTTKHGKSSSSKDALPTGLVKLKSEGTGFSARGSRTVEKSSVAFQC
ncbi:hypothetical protein ACHAPV_010274 [Trichoderma viride]